MKQVWVSPNDGPIDLVSRVAVRAVGLANAQGRGIEFLALPIEDPLDAAIWIFACFHSPVTVIPLPANLPPAILSGRIAQLPPNRMAFPNEIIVSDSKQKLPPLRELNDIWTVIFTSGSSGEPKGVALSGAALKASAEAHASHSGLRRATWLLDLPLFHVGGLSVLTRALFLDAPFAVSSPRFDVEKTVSWLKSRKVQGISSVPTTLHRLLQHPAADLSSLEVVLLGGAPAADSLLQNARARNIQIRLTYGMTEHASQIATERSYASGLEPLPEVELCLQEDGEIFVRSPMLANGFFQSGKLSPLPLQKGFFPTGDLGEFVDRRLRIFGRKSEMIISGAKKIFPREVETVLGTVPGLIDFAVLGVPDEEWGEIVCAAIVEEAKNSFNKKQALDVMRSGLERHKHPKLWVSLSQIPRTESGKIQLGELRRAVLFALKSSHN